MSLWQLFESSRGPVVALYGPGSHSTHPPEMQLKQAAASKSQTPKRRAKKVMIQLLDMLRYDVGPQHRI